jgi:ribosomal protein S6E (S10)
MLKFRGNAMTYVEPREEGNRRRVRMRDLTIGQWLAVVGAACVVVFGMYFLFSLL